jgi:putative phage-type endonuclease
MTLNKMESKIRSLIERYGSNDQRTDAWHTKRGTMLTASEIWKGLKEASASSRHELIMSKLIPRTYSEGSGARALVWGTRFEPVAKSIYCKMQGNIEIVDTTCVPHPKYDFLGASPDGIILTKDPEDFRYGKLVEFKCPISRIFSNETPVPNAYYHQMQLQMECTELEECEYIEMGFKDMTYSSWMDSTAEIKSFFAVSDDDKQVIYKDIDDIRDVPSWRREILKDDGDRWTIIYWALNSWRAKTIEHDKNWIHDNIGSLKNIWDEVTTHRNAGTTPEHPKEKTTLTL